MSDLPRLLLCSFDVIPGPSGSSRRLTEYLKALPDRFSVVVLSAKTPDHSHIEKYQGARLLRVPVGSGDLVSRIQTFERAVRRQLDSEEYALAHFTDPFGGYVLCEMKGDYGYRLIYEAQTFPSQELRYTHPQTESDKRFLAKVRRQELFCLMNADLVITGSQNTRTYIQSLGASTEQIRVIRSPVDLGPYTPDVHGVPDGQPMRLMYLGSQAGWQGLPILLRALALAIEQGAEVKLTLVGARHPDWQPHLEDMAKELGIQGHVEFQPPVLHDDLVKVLALADVGVLPLDDVDRNRLQGGPLAKVSEYFAAGRPVLAADLPVTRELLPPSAVLFHTPGDAKDLADSILKLAHDVPRRLELGREARVFAEQELEAGLIRGKLLDIYDELLGKRLASTGATPSELPAPTMTGTPTNRVSQIKPPEGGKRSRGKSSEKGKGAEKGKGSKKAPARDDLPLVLGQALTEDRMDTRLIKTEPDMRDNEPPVVMGLPLRDQKPTASPPREEPPAPTPVVRPPAALRRERPEEPPTSIVTSMPSESEVADRTPTPIVRSPLGTSAEAPPAPSTRAPIPVREEEPPSPTPIVQMKSLGGGNQGNGAPRSESASSRPPMSPATPKTGSRKAFQDPPPAQEPSEKARGTNLPPITRAAPSSEPKGPPPRLEHAPTPAPRIPLPPDHVPLPGHRPSPAQEPLTPSPTRTAPAQEPSTPSPLRTSPAQESLTPATVRPAPAPEPLTPSPLRTSPAQEPLTPSPARPAPAPEPLTPSPQRASPAQEPPVLSPLRAPPAPEPLTPSPQRTSPAQEPPVLPPLRASPAQEPSTPPPLRASPSSEPIAPPILRGPPPLEPTPSSRTPPPLKPSGVFPSVVAPPPVVAKSVVTKEEEPEEISEEEAQEISEESSLDASPTPPHSRPRLEEPEEVSHDELEEADASEVVEASDDELEEADAAEAIDAGDDQIEEADASEPVEASDDAVEEVDSAEAIDAGDDQVPEADDAVESVEDTSEEASPVAAQSVTEAPDSLQPAPPDSALDPWFAQLAHGYCPPEGAQFARHTPPTNFPGRDEEPTDPSRVPPTPQIQGASRGKSS